MKTRTDMRICIVDDEPMVRSLLEQQLANLGLTDVHSCESGRAALECFTGAKGMPELIVLDLNMPGMDGIEFVRHLVSHAYAGSLILISGENERVLQSVEGLVRAHKLSVLGHLQKPVLPERLSALLETWRSSPARRARAPSKRYSAAEVGAAIAGGELVNFYQPKVAIASGALVGVESLVRWRHPVDGMIFPDQFIGVAEANGLIDDLTRVVLHDALAQARRWMDAGIALKVAVNLSMDNLSSLDFADFVGAQAEAAGMPPQNVVLEVTESRLMKDARAPLEILNRLHLKRFRLSIDDFGTGHSSLSQLRDIPFEELKIDQSFVHHAGSDETRRAIFYASVNLARQLGMESVAEGVEDEADWAFLRGTGCTLAQGYLIARPMPAAELPTWIGDWESRLHAGLVARA